MANKKTKADTKQKREDNELIDVEGYDPVAILGDPNSGKTNLMFYLSNKSSIKKRYLLGYPKKVKGYTSISCIRDLFNAEVKECIVCIDEITNYIKLHEKKHNELFMRLLRFCQHRKIKLIFATQLSQFITKQCEALVPTWAIKQIDIQSLKNGSKPKRIIQDVTLPCIIDGIGMTIEPKEFIWYRFGGRVGENGLYRFPFQNVGKDWGNSDVEEQLKNELEKADLEEQL